MKLKKIMFALAIALFMLLFGSAPAYAEEYQYYVEGNPYYESVGKKYGKHFISFNVANDTYKPFFYTVTRNTNENASCLYYLGFFYDNNGSYSLIVNSGSYFNNILVSGIERGFSSYSLNGQYNAVNSYDISDREYLAFYSTALACEGNVPIFSNHPTLQQVVDVIVNGKTDNLVNPEVLEDPLPAFTDENIVEDSSLGYLKELRYEHVLAYEDAKTDIGLVGGSVNTIDYNNSGYKYTWNYGVSEDAVETSDYITKVQIRVKTGCVKTHFLSKDEYIDLGLFEFADDFEDFPLATLNTHFISYNKIAEYIPKDYDLEHCDCNESYLRLVQYRPDEKRYYASDTWYRVLKNVDTGDPDEVNKSNTKFDTGYFDENGNFVLDGKGPSYSGTSNLGQIEGDEIPDEWLTDAEKADMYDDIKGNGSVGWSWDNINSIANFFGDLPALLGSMFSYVPSVVWWAFAGVLLCIVAMRILGR